MTPWWKRVCIPLFLLFGLFGALPNFFSSGQLEKLPDWLPKKKIILGLDLQGGSHFLLDLKVDRLFEEQLARLKRSLGKYLRSHRVAYHSIQKKKGGVSVLFPSPPASGLLQELKAAFPSLYFQAQGKEVRARLHDDFVKTTKARAVERTIEVIRRRIDGMGTMEPVIVPQGSQRVLVQVPGAHEPETIKAILQSTARLSFHVVEAMIPEDQKDQFVLKADQVLMPSYGPPHFFYLVKQATELTGESLEKASVTFQEQEKDISRGRQPVISLEFDSQGGSVFGEITQQNVGRLMAIALDGEVISAPKIQGPITSRSCIISGDFTVEEANRTALLMRSGALPAPLEILEERVVGPSLGEDSVRKGAISLGGSFLVVALFALGFYAWFGWFAIVSLFVNVMLMIAGLSWLGATLTLPGIAGLAISIGMAIDANILTNERIKEALRRGASPWHAIEEGYEKSKSAILDSNLTTLIGAWILCAFGTGPVAGFGVTLGLGILSSMFTATLFSFWLVKKWFTYKSPKSIQI